MKVALLASAVLAGVLLASCARHPGTAISESRASGEGTVSLGTLSRGSLLETGRTYSGQVRLETTDGRASWCVQNPPIPPHYAVGFEWQNLSNVGNPREGTWTFVVKDIERWHDTSRGGPMGMFTASYMCDVLRIEDARR
jgi:hypothetical protein